MTEQEELSIETENPQESFEQIIMALDYYSQWCEANGMEGKAEHSKALCKKYVRNHPELALGMYGHPSTMPETLYEALPEEYR